MLFSDAKPHLKRLKTIVYTYVVCEKTNHNILKWF